MNRKWTFKVVIFIYFPHLVNSQCLSSVNPVGGTNNLLVLEKSSLRIISFYKYGQGSQYYEGTKKSDFDLSNRAYYNYLSAIVSYGLTSKFTVEIETGYFFNKTQNYNLTPAYSLTGKGLSNAVILAKHGIYTEQVNRIYITGAVGAKIPFSSELQWSENNIKLPVDIQPTIGAYGAVFSTSFVKEISGTGMRYFLTNRIETHAPNKEDYKPGNSVFNSLYISKHLMQSWLKNNWTAILQIRNEIRSPDKINGRMKESSGSTLLFLAPQLNFVVKKEWYLSGMVDFPIFQNFKGTQLGAGIGFAFIVSKTIIM